MTNSEMSVPTMSLRDWFAGIALPLAFSQYVEGRSRDEGRRDVVDFGSEDE